MFVYVGKYWKVYQYDFIRRKVLESIPERLYTQESIGNIPERLYTQESIEKYTSKIVYVEKYWKVYQKEVVYRKESRKKGIY